MSGEIKLFRRELFGGFSRKDVIEYIRKLAGERNRYSEAQKAAEDEIVKLGTAIEELRSELEVSNRLVREVNMSALTDAQQALGELCTEYDDVRSDIEATADHIRGELVKADDTVALMVQTLERAGRRLRELCELVAAEKNLADERIAAMIPETEEERYDPETVLSELKLSPRRRPAVEPDGEESTISGAQHI